MASHFFFPVLVCTHSSRHLQHYEPHFDFSTGLRARQNQQSNFQFRIITNITITSQANILVRHPKFAKPYFWRRGEAMGI